jgi:uncharacterized membrane protein YdjX (TVP38/TMEM64 family)
MKEIRRRKYVKDALVVILSVIAAILLAKSHLLEGIILGADSYFILDSFIAGVFYTSVFTTPPAMVVLGTLGANYPIVPVALFGALGSMLGDLIIFLFLKQHVADNVEDVVLHMKSGRMRHIMKYRFARWSLVLLGGLIIASPFPDELGLTLLGISKISTKRFAIISFVFNVAGIAIVSLVARGLY